MKIEYRTGNLLQASERLLVHGCNARGRMGSGVAKLIRAAYPVAYEAYASTHARDGLRPGQVVWADCGRHVVGNAITQDRYGKDPEMIYADYDAIRTAMGDVERTAAASGEPAVAMPLIGAGLANGSWRRIATIIEEESHGFRPVVYLVDGIVPNT